MTTPDTTQALVNAIQRNTDEDGLGRFLEAFRWSVLSTYVQPRNLTRGQLLIAQGTQDRQLYFLERGDLKVDIHTPGGLTQLALLGPGSVVGEGSFFSHLARNAAVTAFTDCTVWEMSESHFKTLAHDHPHVALALSQALGGVLATRMLHLSHRIAVT